MAQELDLELSLAPPDIWVLKKHLTESDLCVAGTFYLPEQDFEAYIIPEMERGLAEKIGNGVEVKVHIVEEGVEADDYTVTLIKYRGCYMFKGGWLKMAKAKCYKPNDEIGLMWHKWSGRFFFHHIK